MGIEVERPVKNLYKKENIVLFIKNLRMQWAGQMIIISRL